MNEIHAGFDFDTALANGEVRLTAQVQALLREIQQMLIQLRAHGTTNSIDVRSLPLAPGDYELLEAFLGDGEVIADIHTLGLSRIKETRFSGVWWLKHYNIDEEIVAELIEVTLLPDILKTQVAELDQSLTALQRYIEEIQSQR